MNTVRNVAKEITVYAEGQNTQVEGIAYIAVAVPVLKEWVRQLCVAACAASSKAITVVGE